MKCPECFNETIIKRISEFEWIDYCRECQKEVKTEIYINKLNNKSNRG